MIAIIPARAGSKGLPGKNIKPLCGKPLVAYTIKAALKATSINRVIVSTDSEEIACIAKDAGAEIPFLRPPELATDDSIALDAYMYTCNKLIDKESISIESFTVLQPTSPLRNSHDINNAIEIFNSKHADSVISVKENPTPIEWLKVIKANGVLNSLSSNEVNQLLNRQVYKKTYVPNGAIYVFRLSFLVKQKHYYSERTYPYIMPLERSVDIDSSIDFDIAEHMMQKQQKELGSLWDEI